MTFVLAWCLMLMLAMIKFAFGLFLWLWCLICCYSLVVDMLVVASLWVWFAIRLASGIGCVCVGWLILGFS